MVFPKQIGKGLFTIGDKIGNGAFGEVFMAKRSNGMALAIKFEDEKAKRKCLHKEIEVQKLFIYS